MLRHVFIVPLLALYTHTVSAADTLTLAAAIDKALAHNPTQVSQRLDISKAGAQQQAAQGARWPSADFTAAATHYAYPTFVYPIRSLGVFPPMDDTLYDYGVALKLPIYAGGRLQLGARVADLGLDISRERERLGAQGLIYNVSSVYMKIQHLSALVQAYDARITSIEAQERRLALLVRVGRVPKLDHLKVNGLLTKARHDRLQIDNHRRQAWTLLYQLLGEPRPKELTGMQAYVPVAAPAWSQESLWQEAQALRPELRIAERQTAAGALQEKIARGERLPSLAVVGGYRERSGSDRQFFDDWNVGLQLSLPLMDGGVRRAHADEAAFMREQSQLSLEAMRLEINKQLQDAWDEQSEAVSRIAVTESSIAEATESLAIEKLKYEQGVGVITDLLTAESALLTAQADRLQARFDLITSRLNLLRASGALSQERIATLVVPDNTTTTEENKKP